MKRFFIKAFSLIACCTMIMCSNDPDVEDVYNITTYEEPSDILDGQINIPFVDISNYKDCCVTTISGESEIIRGQFSVKVIENNKLQSFIVSNPAGDILLMARKQFSNTKTIVVDCKTTAIAMVMLHPIFSTMNIADFDRSVDIITSSSMYAPFYQEVETVVSDKKALYDSSNTDLMTAFANLMNDLWSNTDDVSITSAVDMIGFNKNTYPLYAKIDNDMLRIRSNPLTPYYSGYVIDPNGNKIDLDISSESEYGFIELLTNTDFLMMGDYTDFKFTDYGRYNFYFSRISPTAKRAFYQRLTSSILDSFGLNSSQKTVNHIAEELEELDLSINVAYTNPISWLLKAYESVIEHMACEYLDGECMWSSCHHWGIFIERSMGWYRKVDADINSIIDLGYTLIAPSEIEFCLSFHSGHVVNCLE